MAKSGRKLYRVRFVDRDEKQPIEVVVTSIAPSEFFGLVTLEGFVFGDNTKFVILPTEDIARKRFGNSDRLHIPTHNLIYVEEFYETPPDVHKLPFIKEVPKSDEVMAVRAEGPTDLDS